MSTIVSIKRVANNSLQAELTDKVQISSKMNVLAKLNKGDARFNVGSLRHAWFPCTLMSLAEIGIPQEKLLEIEKLTQGQSLMLNFQSPMIEGEELAIQVNETINPDEYQSKNALKTAKQLPITMEVATNKNFKTNYDLSKHIGETGYFTDKDGNFIFSRTTVTVKGQVNHTIVEDFEFVPSSQLAEYGATLAPAITVGAAQGVAK